MNRASIPLFSLLVLGWTSHAKAYASAEVFSTESYQYGRFEASIEFVSGSGVVGSYFLWKDGSEEEGAFWNELDFETVDSDCQLKTNAYYGQPAAVHSQAATVAPVCGALHTFAYEWTPDYVAWLVDGAEVRRETGEAAAAYRDNAAEGMQLRFNIWPGDASFGGTFDPNLLPVYQRVDWVQYSSYNGSAFSLEWREDFSGDAIPAGWELGNWDSPKGLSTHSQLNVGVVDGFLVLALTADDAQGVPGFTPPADTGGQGGTAGSGGTDPTGGATGGGAGGNGGGNTSTNATASVTGAAGSSTSGTDSVTTSSVGSATAGGTATMGGTSQSGTTTTSVATTATNGTAMSSTATGSTGGPTTGDATVLGGTNGSGAGPTESSEGGCACRAAGARPISRVPSSLGGFVLFALGALLRIRRRSEL